MEKREGKRTENTEYVLCSLEKVLEVREAVTLIDACREPDFYFEGERHNFWELVYVLEGKVGITADERIYTLAAGDIIFHKPMEFHRIWSSEGTQPHVYILSFTAKGEGMKRLEQSSFQLEEKSRSLLEALVQTGKRAFLLEEGAVRDVRDAGESQRYGNLLELFLLEAGSGRDVASEKSEEARMFEQIMGVLNRNVYGRISVEEVARQCHLSVSCVKKRFHKYTGMGVAGYFHKLKMKKAMELLEQGCSVGEVSERLSFSSPFYFSSVFKKETGMSPSAYRKKR